MAAQSSDQGNNPAVKIDKSHEYYFDDADFLLHSAPYDYTSDRQPMVMEYRVHRAKLAKSPVFADLLELGQATEPTDQLPLVRLVEHSYVVTSLLRFLCGDVRRYPQDFEDDLGYGPEELYEACFKYDMPVAHLAVEMMIRTDLQVWDKSVIIDCYRVAKRNDRHDFAKACLGRLACFDVKSLDIEALGRLVPHEWVGLVTAREEHLKAEHQ